LQTEVHHIGHCPHSRIAWGSLFLDFSLSFSFYLFNRIKRAVGHRNINSDSTSAPPLQRLGSANPSSPERSPLSFRDRLWMCLLAFFFGSLCDLLSPNFNLFSHFFFPILPSSKGFPFLSSPFHKNTLSLDFKPVSSESISRPTQAMSPFSKCTPFLFFFSGSLSRCVRFSPLRFPPIHSPIVIANCSFDSFVFLVPPILPSLPSHMRFN